MVQKVTIRLQSVNLNRHAISITLLEFHSRRPNNVKLIRTRSSRRRHSDLGNVCRGSLAFGNKLIAAVRSRGKWSYIHITVPVGGLQPGKRRQVYANHEVCQQVSLRRGTTNSDVITIFRLHRDLRLTFSYPKAKNK